MKTFVLPTCTRSVAIRSSVPPASCCAYSSSPLTMIELGSVSSRILGASKAMQRYCRTNSLCTNETG